MKPDLEPPPFPPPLWSAQEAEKATNGQLLGVNNWAATGISIDTRTLSPGDLFIALKDLRDGHDFIAEAFRKGASAALVSHIPPELNPETPLLMVKDVQKGLEALGHAARARTHAKIIAITGSAGKTSTKEMLREMLGRQGKLHAAEASYNNHWGVPLTLARMPTDTDFAIIEIGMNHPGEIAPLAKMAAPHVAMITNVAAAHLEAFTSLKDIAYEKASIFKGLSPNGWAIINHDLDTFGILQEQARLKGAQMLTYGYSDRASFQLIKTTPTQNVSVIQARNEQGDILIRLNTTGRHFAMNALGALAACQVLGADIAIAACDIINWSPPSGRGGYEHIIINTADDTCFTLIDDAFNANPASMAAGLDILIQMTPSLAGRRIAILGDMLELGQDTNAYHHAIAQHQDLSKISTIHCIGPKMKHLYDALPIRQKGLWADNISDFLAQPRMLQNIVNPDDIVLVKGSKGSKVAQVVDALRRMRQRTK